MNLNNVIKFIEENKTDHFKKLVAENNRKLANKRTKGSKKTMLVKS